MTKEKMISLKRYAQGLKDKLADKAIPKKHEGHPETYKAFLTRELKTVSAALDEAAINAVADKK